MSSKISHILLIIIFIFVLPRRGIRVYLVYVFASNLKIIIIIDTLDPQITMKGW